jgi:glutamine amidotransferase
LSAIPRVVVVDYGIGNVFSVCQAVRHAGAEPVLTGDFREVTEADRLILPGVGAFGRAAGELRVRRLDEPIQAFKETGRPFLGICVGMQLMLDASTEMGDHRGLGFVDGVVNRVPEISADGSKLRVPHVGWSEVLVPADRDPGSWSESVLAGIQPGRSAFYFVHSYAAEPTNANDVLAQVDYGGRRLVAAISKDNVTGVQFHPERSSVAGQRVLEWFIQS